MCLTRIGFADALGSGMSAVPAPYDNEEANYPIDDGSGAVPKRPHRESVARASAAHEKITDEDLEDAKLSTANQLRHEMNDKSKQELLDLAVGHNQEAAAEAREAEDRKAALLKLAMANNEEVQDEIAHGHPAPADDGGDYGDGNGGAAGAAGVPPDVAQRNAALLKLAMANNEEVQEEIKHEHDSEDEMADKRMKLLEMAYANAERKSAYDISEVPVTLDDVLAQKALERASGSTDADDADGLRTNSYKEATSGGPSEDMAPTSITHNDITARDRHMEIVVGSAAEERRRSEAEAEAPKKKGGCCIVM